MPPRRRKTDPPPSGVDTLGPRGTALHRQLHTDGHAFDPLTEELVLEACRLADRLERLDRIANGEAQEWVDFRDQRDGTVVVWVDSVLGEARHTAVALKQLVSEITKAKAPPAPAKPAEEDPLDVLEQRRRQRRGQATA